MTLGSGAARLQRAAEYRTPLQSRLLCPDALSDELAKAQRPEGGMVAIALARPTLVVLGVAVVVCTRR
jgi:hypothetical protein